uniref:Secreted protein n=1 Tax=Candidatus Kentrum sp. MB TaxID=2138164 RepID=A0A451BCK9_9GAMM|nr:MAG: hypothetical protein BECKMB1821I_GA0114274_10416 [Candidatus Kentron sp. MB]VFK76027.1 MAG: hypothetical protein BECKMB1821H_GA0114242_10396 [Candidatus Kentron sp. MB]
MLMISHFFRSTLPVVLAVILVTVYSSASAAETPIPSAKKWWGDKQHDKHIDRILANKTIDYGSKDSECISKVGDNGPKKQPLSPPFSETSTYRIGAFLHPHAWGVRDRTWKAVYKRGGKTTKSDKLWISVVPYLEMGEKQYPIVPEGEGEEFKGYRLACNESVFWNHFLEYPHYYTTVALTVTAPNNDSRDSLVTALRETATNARERRSIDSLRFLSPTTTSLTTQPKTLKELLNKISKHNKAQFQKQTIKPKDKITVNVLGLGTQNSNFSVTHTALESKSPRRNTTPPEQPLPEQSQKRFSIRLPQDWEIAEFLRTPSMLPNAKMENCESGGMIQSLPSADPSSYVTDCAGPNARLEMPGFEPIPRTPDGDFYIKSSNENFQGRDIKPARLKIVLYNQFDRAIHARIEDHQGNTIFGPELFPPKKETPIPIPLRYFENNRHIRVIWENNNANNPHPCNAITELDLKSATRHSKHNPFRSRLKEGCFQLDIKWPTLWPTPKADNCNSIRDLGNGFRCLSPFGPNKPIRLNFGSLWEPIEITEGNTRTIGANDMRARWPFESTWWTGLDTSSTGSDPKACDATPGFSPTSVTYHKDFNGMGTKTIPWEKANSLPTLQDINWQDGWPLPRKVTLRYQQSAPFNPQYTNTLQTFAWKESDVSNGKKWSLSKLTERKSLRVTKFSKEYPVKIDTSQFPNISNASVQIDWFNSSDACKSRKKIEKFDYLGSVDPKRQCKIARLRQENTPISACTRGNLVDGEHLKFSFEPLCKGKRRILAVSNVQEFDKLFGRDFLTTLADAIATPSNRHSSDSRRAFSLYTIGELGGKEALRCEDIADLKQSVIKKAVQERISDFRFNAIRTPIADLKMISEVYADTKLDQVLYLSGNRNLRKPDRLTGEDTFVLPWLYTTKGARLRVLVPEPGCDSWRALAKKANVLLMECEPFDKKTAVNTLKKELQKFFAQ